MLKNNNSSSMAPADALHKHHVWERGNPPPTEGEYKGGDIIWIKTLCSKCTTKFRTKHIIHIVSQQSCELMRYLAMLKTSSHLQEIPDNNTLEDEVCVVPL